MRRTYEMENGGNIQQQDLRAMLCFVASDQELRFPVEIPLPYYWAKQNLHLRPMHTYMLAWKIPIRRFPFTVPSSIALAERCYL